MPKFNYLVIYKNTRPKMNLYGWKIFYDVKEVDELFIYYKSQKKIDIFINEKLSITYDKYEELDNDVEIVPLTQERTNALVSTFEGSVFGLFPL